MSHPTPRKEAHDALITEMLVDGVPYRWIALYTGLSISAVEQRRAKLRILHLRCHQKYRLGATLSDWSDYYEHFPRSRRPS